MFAGRHLHWVDVDPVTHPFDPVAVRAHLRTVTMPSKIAAYTAGQRRMTNILANEVGLWAAGWTWDLHDGGPVTHVAGEPAEVAMEALVVWRNFIEVVAKLFATLPRQASTEYSIELAANQLLPIVLQHTQVTDAWYSTLGCTLAWYIEYAELDGGEDLHRVVEDVVGGEFHSWLEPVDAAASCRSVAQQITSPRLGTLRDATADWQAIRTGSFRDIESIACEPVTVDGHARYIDEVDRRRDPERAERMHAALLLARDSARRGVALAFDQLAEWQAIVLGESQPATLRTTDAFAKRGRDRYPIRADLGALVARALADAQTFADDELAFASRLARLYLDICFLHPFADGNARAARLAFDYMLTSHGYAIREAAPIFRLARVADDATSAWSFAHAIDLLIGPTTSR